MIILNGTKKIAVDLEIAKSTLSEVEPVYYLEVILEEFNPNMSMILEIDEVGFNALQRAGIPERN